MNKSILAILSLAAACSAGSQATSVPSNPDNGGQTGGTQTGGDGQTGGGTTGSETGGTTGTTPGGTTGSETGGGNDLGCNKMDILFVIDNSGSMSEEQENLVQNFPRFIEVLNNFKNGALDYRVAVTTTSFRTELLGIPLGQAAQGALLKAGTMTNPWLSRTDPNVAATFTELATVGLGGSGQEQPLRAARAAVTDRVADGANKDFLREDALLAVVILTDEEDDSKEAQMGGGSLPLPGAAMSVADVVAAFDMVKGERSRWATAVIAGDEDPTCDSQFGNAKYAPRLLDFVEQTGKNGVFSSICEGDLSLSIEDALKTFSLACDDFVLI